MKKTMKKIQENKTIIKTKEQIKTKLIFLITIIKQVMIPSLGILLILGLFNYEYTIKNYISSIALYFLIEEIKHYTNTKILKRG